jgi:hypothetical protein
VLERDSSNETSGCALKEEAGAKIRRSAWWRESTDSEVLDHGAVGNPGDHLLALRPVETACGDKREERDRGSSLHAGIIVAAWRTA